MNHEWLPLHQNIIEIENALTTSNLQTGDAFDWRVERYHPGMYVPLRKDVADILRDWQTASIQDHTYTSLDDEGGAEDAIYQDIAYVRSLYDYARKFNAKDHIDLGHQALTEARLMTESYRDLPDSIYHRIIAPDFMQSVTSRIDKPVFFVIDFDHTVARTTAAFQSLIRTVYYFLPAKTREHTTPEQFTQIFQEAYALHKKAAGMFKPDLFIRELVIKFGLHSVPRSLRKLSNVYSQSYMGKMYEGAGLVLNRWQHLGKSTILTFGDQDLQSSSVTASGTLQVVDGLSAVNQKSPEVILSALQKIGYAGEGYVIGIGDRPSDAAAIKSFSKDSVSIRIRHPDGKYASEKPKSQQEIPDHEYRSLLNLDFDLHHVFQKMIRRNK